MKPEAVTKLKKRNKAISKKFGDDVISTNYDVIAIFMIYDQFGAIQKPDSRRIVWKTYIFINSNLLCYKKVKTELKNLLHSSHTIVLSKNAIFAKECWFFAIAVAANENDKAQKNVAFKNTAPFRSCISKINNTLIYNAEDLNIVMPRYNLLEHSQNCSITSGSFGHYYRDEIDDVDENDGKSCKYKTKKVEKTPRRP